MASINISAISHRSAYDQCFCLDESTLVIRLRTGKEITSVTIFQADPFEDGISDKSRWQGCPIAMNRQYELPYHILWSCSVQPQYKRLQYYFQISCDSETIYLFEDGCYQADALDNADKVLQYFIMPWMNTGDIARIPDWVVNTIWYQIFPDRFCRGNMGKKRYSVKPWQCEDHMTYTDFYGGDLEGIINRLPYLADLGITGIYMTPVFASNTNHKYNIADYRQIDPDFGTEDELKSLIEAAHSLGIRVMLDAVFNHCDIHFAPWQDVIHNGASSPYYDWFLINDLAQTQCLQNEWSSRDGRYYTFAFQANMPKLNTSNPDVVSYLTGLCQYWADTWKIDGIRFDVGDETSHCFLKHLRSTLKDTHPDLFLLGEIWHDSTQWLQGDEYDSVMDYPFLSSINDFWKEPSRTARNLMQQLNLCFTRYPEQIARNMFHFLDTHDTPRAFTRCGDLDIFFQQLALLMTLQGSICLYYGTEIAMSGEHDPQNRKCMPWDQILQGNYDYITDEVKRLIEIRKTYPACSDSDIQWLISETEPRLIHYQKNVHNIAHTDVIEVLINADFPTDLNNLHHAAIFMDNIDPDSILYTRKFDHSILQSGGILILKK